MIVERRAAGIFFCPLSDTAKLSCWNVCLSFVQCRELTKVNNVLPFQLCELLYKVDQRKSELLDKLNYWLYWSSTK